MDASVRSATLTETHICILQSSILWKNRPITVEALPGGLTNRNYLVRSGLGLYVARFGFSLNPLLGIDREKEILNTTRAAGRGLGPDVVGHFSKYRLLVVRYIEGIVFDTQRAQEAEHIVLVARLLRTLHTEGPWCVNSRDVFKDIKGYVAEAHKRNSWIPEKTAEYFRTLRIVEGLLGVVNKTACHFDLMLGNILRTHDGILKLIDWEYSANGDPRFDVAMFALKADLNRSQEEILLNEYNDGGKNGGMTLRELQLMKMTVCMREASWGMLQNSISEMKKDFDYKQYAVEHLALFDILQREIAL